MSADWVPAFAGDEMVAGGLLPDGAGPKRASVTRARTRRASLWLLLFAALFMRAFVPQDYMPERSDSGAITVAICGSGGVHVIPLDDGAGSERDEQRAAPPCAFAGLASPAAPPPAGPDLPLPAPVAVAYADHPAAAASFAAPRLLPPARGPPLPA